MVVIWSNTVNYLFSPKFERINFMTLIFIYLQDGVCKLCCHVSCCIFTPYQEKRFAVVPLLVCAH